ncbi:MAG TPA: alpha-galactosidase, partial [Lachnospiraceae bacterium]|nr:alpha-galactosidase [Lachnospiraceae bacterium]
MAILFDSAKRIFTLQTRTSTYQMQADSHDRLLHLYYGRRTEGTMDYVLTFRDRGFCPNPPDAGMDRTYSLDCLPQEYPSQGTGDFRSHALMAETKDGKIGCDPRYVSYKIQKGKYALKGLPTVYAGEEDAETLIIKLEDPAAGVRVELYYGVLPESDIITRCAKITNLSEETLYLHRALSANLDFVTGHYDLISFYGYQGLERSFQRNPVTHTEQTLISRRGTSSHQFNPLCILAEPDTTETAGACIAVQMLYSGGSMAVAAMDPFEGTRFQMGVSDYAFRYPLAKGETFTAPEAVLCRSGKGLGDLSIKLT